MIGNRLSLVLSLGAFALLAPGCAVSSEPVDEPAAASSNALGRGRGVSTPAVVRNALWYERASNTGGTADAVIAYGNPGDIAIAGDWNGDGIDTPGVVRSAHWYLRNSNSWGYADVDFVYGNAGDKPLAGRWGLVR